MDSKINPIEIDKAISHTAALYRAFQFPGMRRELAVIAQQHLVAGYGYKGQEITADNLYQQIKPVIRAGIKQSTYDETLLRVFFAERYILHSLTIMMQLKADELEIPGQEHLEEIMFTLEGIKPPESEHCEALKRFTLKVLDAWVNNPRHSIRDLRQVSLICTQVQKKLPKKKKILRRAQEWLTGFDEAVYLLFTRYRDFHVDSQQQKGKPLPFVQWQKLITTKV